MKAEEQVLSTQSVNFNNCSIEVNNVSFGSHDNKEMLHGISLSIARAMLKNAPIVILDEATANVDPENEDRLQKAIEALTRDKTIIMIAHRLKTVRHADQILVIDRGRIVQKGKHEQLIAEPGIYADFVGGKKQAVDWKL